MNTGPSTDLKRTKRVRDASEDLTLEEHIAVHRQKLLAARNEVPQILNRATRLREQSRGMVRRFERRTANDLVAAAENLDREAAARQSMSREHEFEATVVTYLRRYHVRADPSTSTHRKATIETYMRNTDLARKQQCAILDEYLTYMNRAPPKVAMAARDDCPRCATHPKLLLCAARSTMTCPECGYAVTFLDSSTTSTSFDDVIEFSQYSYKRVTHYMMWLALVQGKEAHVVPDDVLHAVMKDLYARLRLTDVKDITQHRVRESLRRMRLRRAYDHVAQITARISGIPPPRITPDVEEKLRTMFLKMQPAFAQHAPKTRTNFLSYPYVLWRSFQILGLHHMCEGMSLLKGRDKLEANDAIFRRMAADLGWKLSDLPPDAPG